MVLSTCPFGGLSALAVTEIAFVGACVDKSFTQAEGGGGQETKKARNVVLGICGKCSLNPCQKPTFSENDLGCFFDHRKAQCQAARAF